MNNYNMGSRSSSLHGTPSGQQINQNDSARTPSDAEMSLHAHKRSLEQLLWDIKQRLN